MKKSIFPSLACSWWPVAGPVAEMRISVSGTYLLTAWSHEVLTMNGVVPGGRLPSV